MLYLDQKKYSDAIEAFRNSLKVNPYYTEAHYQIALAYFMEKDKKSALQAIELALKTDPANPKYRELFSKVESS